MEEKSIIEPLRLGVFFSGQAAGPRYWCLNCEADPKQDYTDGTLLERKCSNCGNEFYDKNGKELVINYDYLELILTNLDRIKCMNCVGYYCVAAPADAHYMPPCAKEVVKLMQSD